MLKKYVLGMALSLFVCTCYAMNLSEIEDMTRLLACDVLPGVGNPHFTTASIDDYINVIQSEMASNTWCCEGKRDYPVVYGQREYVLSDDVIAVTRLTIDNVRIPATSLVKMDDNTSWESNITTTTPSEYFIVNTTASYIAFDTYPSTTTDTTITIYYIKNPPKMTASTDIPFDGQPRYESFHIGIVYGAVAMLFYQDKKYEEAKVFYAMYLDRIKAMERIIRLSGDYIPSFSGDNNIK